MTKKHGTKAVLNNIWLSFYPGAKIGVLGRNGTGKSTLLKIMAGIDKEFDGEARLTDGFTVGYLPQEPHLNPEKNVWVRPLSSLVFRGVVVHRFDSCLHTNGDSHLLQTQGCALRSDLRTNGRGW
ncbi:ATP-binding cassette domain-containing protein [Mariniblastus sp.]|nr:ATP-binding cassette domain-containing protein [Mariniblastus sp.]